QVPVWDTMHETTPFGTGLTQGRCPSRTYPSGGRANLPEGVRRSVGQTTGSGAAGDQPQTRAVVLRADLRGRNGPAEVVALAEAAAVIGEEPPLFLRLDALGDGSHAQAVRQLDDGAD